jgi:hypothetical protein
MAFSGSTSAEGSRSARTSACPSQAAEAFPNPVAATLLKKEQTNERKRWQRALKQKEGDGRESETQRERRESEAERECVKQRE